MEENNHILQVPQKTCCIMPTDTSCFLCGNWVSRRISVTVGSLLRSRNKKVCYSNHTTDVGEENLRQCPINLKEGLQIDATQWRDLGKWQMNTCGYVPVAVCLRVSAELKAHSCAPRCLIADVYSFEPDCVPSERQWEAPWGCLPGAYLYGRTGVRRWAPPCWPLSFY